MGGASLGGGPFAFQEIAEACEGLDGEGLGAGVGIDGSGGESGLNCRGVVAGGAEVVGERLSLLREGLAGKAQEGFFFYSQLREARREAPAEDGGVDVGWRGEGSGREREERLSRAVHLDGDGEQSVIARSGSGYDAVSDFALHHEHGAIECGVTGGEFEQDGRGDVVGQIAGDSEALACGSGGSGEVELEDVLLDDGEALGRILRAQTRGQFTIQLNGNYVGGAGEEGLGDGALAGADFDDSLSGEVAECGGNALNGVGIAKEVLT